MADTMIIKQFAKTSKRMNRRINRMDIEFANRECPVPQSHGYAQLRQSARFSTIVGDLRDDYTQSIRASVNGSNVGWGWHSEYATLAIQYVWAERDTVQTL